MPQANARSIIRIDPRASAKLRKRIEAVIEKLITALDAFETPAEDLEPNGDEEPGGDEEPSLGSLHGLNQTKWCEPAPDHSLAGIDLEADDSDREPSLGSVTFWDHENQENWSSGDDSDREGDEHDGREPDVEDEASLGWTAGMNQGRIARDCEEYWGRGCLDGEGPECDCEPSLGSVASSPHEDQTMWADGTHDDCEDEHDGCEPDVDDEPLLPP